MFFSIFYFITKNLARNMLLFFVKKMRVIILFPNNNWGSPNWFFYNVTKTTVFRCSKLLNQLIRHDIIHAFPCGHTQHASKCRTALTFSNKQPKLFYGEKYGKYYTINDEFYFNAKQYKFAYLFHVFNDKCQDGNIVYNLLYNKTLIKGAIY